MPGRVRNQVHQFPVTGSYYYQPAGTTVYRTGGTLSTKTTSDVTGNYPNPNGFRSVSFISENCVFNGAELYQPAWPPNSPPYVRKKVVNWPPTYTLTTTGLGMSSIGSSEAQNLANQILASTNPGVPHLSVPTFVGELKDVPSLVRDWGGDLLKKVAKGYISWRWAVRPMISDIRDLLRFQDAVNKRIRMLENLRSRRSIKTRCSLGSSSTVVALSDVFIESQAALWMASRTQYDTIRSWGSAQWKLSSSYVLPKTNEGIVKLAYRLTFGINSYEALATMWELLPWSWFADWFLGVGTAIAAGNSAIPVTGGNTCVMRNAVRTIVLAPRPFGSSESWCIPSGRYYFREEIKDRQVVFPGSPLSPTVLPLIDGGKWSILGALAALRRR